MCVMGFSMGAYWTTILAFLFLFTFRTQFSLLMRKNVRLVADKVIIYLALHIITKRLIIINKQATKRSDQVRLKI
eukprot:UN26065